MELFVVDGKSIFYRDLCCCCVGSLLLMLTMWIPSTVISVCVGFLAVVANSESLPFDTKTVDVFAVAAIHFVSLLLSLTVLVYLLLLLSAELLTVAALYWSTCCC